MKIFRYFPRCLLLLLLIGLGIKARAPYFLPWREWLPLGYLAVGGLWAWRFRDKRVWAALFLIAATLPILSHARHQWQRHQVLSAAPETLQRLGRHFIVGYRDFKEIERLVSRGAIGGIFITQRNIEGKSAAQVRAEIQYLQDLQATNGLPPLYVAADQEGGLVSRLSPLVEKQPALSEWRKTGSASEYAEIQARGLADLGVNLNFSPVVDLKTPEQMAVTSGWSLVGQRAISDDPRIVAETAQEYCATFDRWDLRCTLKHFPGLGKVTTDTHWFEGHLNASRQELETHDWLPFRQVTSQTKAFIMLGHVRLTKVDPSLPASLSKTVVSDLIRGQWGHDGIILTDDFTMGPIAGRRGGVGPSSELALNAGVDLILISYDGELYYEAMAHLMKIDERGHLESAMLQKSALRLEQDRISSSEKNGDPCGSPFLCAELNNMNLLFQAASGGQSQTAEHQHGAQIE